jgi:DNA-binding CsgD family transcriptional regulator
MKKEIRAISVRMSLFAAYMLIYMCSQSMMVGQELPDMTDGSVRLYLYVAQQLAVMVGFIIPALCMDYFKAAGGRTIKAVLFLLYLLSMGSLWIGFGIAIHAVFIVICSLCMGITGALIYAFLACKTDFNQNDDRKKTGCIIGVGGALAIILQSVLNVIPDKGSIIIALLLTACYAGVLKAVEIPIKTVQREEKQTWKRRGVCLCVAVLCVLTLLAYYESHMNRVSFGGHFYSWVRIFAAAGYFIIGISYGSARRWIVHLMMIYISMASVISGYMMSKAGEAWWIHLALFYIVLGGIVAYYNLMFMEISGKTPAPVLWASMGRIIDAGITAVFTVISAFLPVADIPMLFMSMGLLAVLIAAMVVGGLLSVGSSGVRAADNGVREAAAKAQDGISVDERINILSEQFGLTPRETEVFGILVTTECKNQEIADRLYISRRQLQNHIASIYQKTGANTRAGLLMLMGN